METADMLEMLDLENDSKLQESAQKIKEAVLKNGYETLKEDEDARKDVVRDVEGELDEITKAVEEMA
jgi:outer membrane protein assembly factor BamA